MRILFINAINPLSEVQYRWPNLGLGYLASALREHFGPKEFEFKIVDSDVERELDAFKPHVVGITAVSQNYNYAKAYARAAKKRSIPVIIGGVHISALPETMTEDMDVAVLGEGEKTVVDLMAGVLEYGRFRPDTVGTARRLNGELVITVTQRSLIQPLDNIPFPARDLLSIRKQSNIFSSRGCPYRCVFCSSSRYWQKVRFFSAEYVVEEIKEMAGKYGVKRINFYDDLMIADGDRLHKMVSLIRGDRRLSGIKFWINARANLINEEMARLLKEMGVVSVGLGLESGNARTLRYLKGGSVAVADNYNAVKNLHKHGIAANGSFIIGSPDETKEEIMDTYRFIQKSDLDFADTFVLFPLPGTPVWDDALKRGLVGMEMDWNRLNVYHLKSENPVLVSHRVGKEEMARLYKKFKRQRLWIAARRAWFSPYFGEMVRAGLVTVKNGFKRLSCVPQYQ